MKIFHVSTTGGKKVVAVSVALALLLASVSVISAFAAPPSDSDTSEQVLDRQIRELHADRVWFDNFKVNHENLVDINSLKAQQWLSRYALALAQADAIVAGRGAVVTTSQSTDEQVNHPNRADESAEQNLAIWLHEMHGLQKKLTGGDTNDMDNS